MIIIKLINIVLLSIITAGIFSPYFDAKGSSDPYANLIDAEEPSEKLFDITKYNDATYTYSSRPQTMVSSEDISRGVDNTLFFSSPNSPIQIRKVFSPGNKSNYLLGDPIGVYVEISSTGKELTDIFVLEVIDDELCVLNISNEFGKMSSIDAISEYYRDLNSDDFLEPVSCINKNGGCLIDPLNRSGIFLNKSEREYNLMNFNLSNDFNSLEFNNTSKVLNEAFNILWANSESASYNKSINRILIKKVDGLDFVDIIINNNSRSALVNISNDRIYAFKAQRNSKSIMINETEVALKFDFTKLLKTEIFAYKYYIKPKKSGNFNTMTLVRCWDNSDTKYISSIDVKEPNPLFDITPRPKYLKIIQSFYPFDQALDLVYDITYLGGASEPELHNAKLKLENDIDYYICSFSNKKDDDAKTMNFTKYKTAHIPTNVKFNYVGIISVPGIYINDKLYNFKDTTIEVYTITGYLLSIVTNYNFVFTIGFALIIFVILIVTGKTPNEIIKRKWSVLNGIRKRKNLRSRLRKEIYKIMKFTKNIFKKNTL